MHHFSENAEPPFKRWVLADQGIGLNVEQLDKALFVGGASKVGKGGQRDYARGPELSRLPDSGRRGRRGPADRTGPERSHRRYRGGRIARHHRRGGRDRHARIAGVVAPYADRIVRNSGAEHRQHERGRQFGHRRPAAGRRTLGRLPGQYFERRAELAGRARSHAGPVSCDLVSGRRKRVPRPLSAQ